MAGADTLTIEKEGWLRKAQRGGLAKSEGKRWFVSKGFSQSTALAVAQTLMVPHVAALACAPGLVR